MSSLPPAIFFINGDITYPPPTPPGYFVGAVPSSPQSDASVSELTNLQIQLFIDDTMTKVEFDARVAADPNYPRIVHLQNLRILVIVPLYNDGYNYMAVPNIELADVVLFLHQGLADVEFNRFGKVDSPGKSYDIQRITMYSLLRAAHSTGVIILPFQALPHCGQCDYPFFCDRCHTFSGMKVCPSCKNGCGCGCGTALYNNQGIKEGIIWAPNCDNEAHNQDFIYRK